MEFVSGNILIRQNTFVCAGNVLHGHKHNFDHTTYVVNGAILIEKLNDDGTVAQSTEKRARDGYNWVLIKADSCHRITALEDNTIMHCVYAHRTPQGEVVQEYTGWREAYV